MRYKVVKKISRHNNLILERYLVKREVQLFGFKIWKYCRNEKTDFDDWLNPILNFWTIDSAEDYIKEEISKRAIADSTKLGTFDIKVYECRDSKLERILK